MHKEFFKVATTEQDYGLMFERRSTQLEWGAGFRQRDFQKPPPGGGGERATAKVAPDPDSTTTTTTNNNNNNTANNSKSDAGDGDDHRKVERLESVYEDET